MRTDILGHPPSLCNCRRVWHPAIPTQPLRGCTCLKCTNQAATASSHSKRLLCILRVPWDNTTQPKHQCASVPSVGGLLSGRRGYGRDAIPSQVCSVGSTSLLGWCSRDCCTPWGTSVSICEICGRTPRTLTFYVFRGRTRAVCLSTRPSSTSEINDYGYAPG